MSISKKTFWIILLALVLIRVIMVVFLTFDIPDIATRQEGQWLVRGDTSAYFDLAKSFVDLNPIEVEDFAFIGYPLFLAPFIYISQASEASNILGSVIILQAFVFFSLAIILIGLIARKILKSRLAGILAAAIFTFLPYIFYFFFKGVGPVYKGGFTSSMLNFESMMWVRVLTDPLSAFLVYSTFCLFLISMEKEKTNKWPILLGILGGLAVLARFTNIFILGVIILICLMQKKIRKVGLVAVFAFFAFLPQVIYDYLICRGPIFLKSFLLLTSEQNVTRLFGDPIQFKSIAQPGFSVANYQYILFLMDKYIPKVELVLISLIILFVFGLTFLYHKNRLGFVVILLWLLPYLAFYGLFPPGARNVRYHFPIFPPLIILGISSFFFIFYRLKELTIYFKKKTL